MLVELFPLIAAAMTIFCALAIGAEETAQTEFESECRWQPRWVHSRYAATLLRPSRTIAPLPGFRSSSEDSSPGARYSAKFFTAVTFSFRKLPTAHGIMRSGS
jgi:hypothetical protein